MVGCFGIVFNFRRYNNFWLRHHRGVNKKDAKEILSQRFERTW
jgi:hypothetical protein